MQIKGVDFVAVPSTDWKRSRAFYVDTLGLRPDENAQAEFWVGDTCFGIYEPASFGLEFAPQKNAHVALHVDDVATARAELEAKGIEFNGDTFDTGVCHMAFFNDPDGNDADAPPSVQAARELMDVERIDYVRVPVTDMEEANHFYGEVLGLRRNPNSPGDDWVEYEVGNVTLAVMTPHTHDYEFAPLPPVDDRTACCRRRGRERSARVRRARGR